MNSFLLPSRRAFLGSSTLGVLAMSTPSLPYALALEGANPTRQSGAAGRSGDLIVRTADPLNAEPALNRLVEQWITPNPLFFIRSHAPTPELDVETFRLEVAGMVRAPQSFKVTELQERFAKVSRVATLTCAGNRRNEHSRQRQVPGVPWGAGAIGNAKWTGIRLADLLNHVGILEGAKHVWFESVDQIEKNGRTFPFGGSIPLEKVLEVEEGEPGPLVTFRMNEQPLPPDHGYPVRMVVPGFIGARSVKWLGKIVVSDRPSPNHYLTKAYKVVEEDRPEQWRAAEPIHRYVLNSVIGTPSTLPPRPQNAIAVRGYALPPGDFQARIKRVEISSDQGRTWQAARLDEQQAPFCWQLWDADVAVAPETESLLVRATDSQGNTQPAEVPWNAKGYLYNAWHRVER